jgi:hypothetical protein
MAERDLPRNLRKLLTISPEFVGAYIMHGLLSVLRRRLRSHPFAPPAARRN